MNLLLDTNIVILTMSQSGRVSKRIDSVVRSADVVFVSPVSVWEIATKAMAGKLAVNLESLTSLLAAAGYVQLPLTWAHAATVRALPFIHRDPFDRMLVAQAIAEPLRLVTTDRLLARYSELVTVV